MFLVRDYDEAIAFFTEALRFKLIEDTPLADSKRWVRVAPPGSSGTSLVLAQAASAEQLARVGDQGGGRVFLFLHTDDFRRDYEDMKARGVVFREAPRERVLWHGGRLRGFVRQPLGSSAASRLSPTPK